MPVKGGPNIQTAQALVFLDSADKLSYPGTGTTWTNTVSPGTFNGTLANGVGFNSSDALGALLFTSSNSYVDVGNIGAISASFSFQVAVKPFPTSSGGVYTILSYTSGSGTGSLTFKLDYSSSSQIATLSTFVSSGSVNKTYNLTASVSTGSWTILHGTYNGASFALYKNGTLDSSTITTGSFTGYSSNSRLLVGGISQFTGSYLSGSVANVAVYNSGLGRRGVATNYNSLATRFGLPNTTIPTSDQDAQAFIDAAGIVDPIQIQAINTLVVDLKSYNIWSKMKAIYPMVGGTATTHRYNLKNPSTFIGTFVGGWTHSTTGATPNGVNAYMDTGLSPFTELTGYSQHVSNYSRTQNTSFNGVQIGCYDGTSEVNIYQYYAAINAKGSSLYFYPTTAAYANNTNTRGLAIGSRTADNNAKLYFNGSLLNTNTTTETRTRPNRTLYLGASNFFSGTSQFTPHENAFSSIGDGLTDTEAANLYTIVQNYQTALGRQV